jgi:hypothetical protein
VGLKQARPRRQQLTFQHPIGGDHDFSQLMALSRRPATDLANNHTGGYSGRAVLRLWQPRRHRLAAAYVTRPQSELSFHCKRVSASARDGRAASAEPGFLDLAFEETRCTLPPAGWKKQRSKQDFFKPRGETSAAEKVGSIVSAPAVELAFTENRSLKNCRFSKSLGRR